MALSPKFTRILGVIILLTISLVIYIISGKEDDSKPDNVSNTKNTHGGSRAISQNSSRAITPRSHQTDSGNQLEVAVKITSTGFLPSEVSRQIGLTEEESQKVQQLLSQYWGIMRDKTLPRVVLDEALSESKGEGVFCYKIPAITKVEREKIFTDMLGDMSQLIDVKLSKIIIEGVNNNESFAYFGKYDTVVTTAPMMEVVFDENDQQVGDPVILPGERTVKYEYINPYDGKPAVKITGDLEKLNKSFGGIFLE